jgi:hypothetical protein
VRGAGIIINADCNPAFCTWPTGNLAAGTYRYKIPGLTPGTTYYARVSAYIEGVLLQVGTSAVVRAFGPAANSKPLLIAPAQQTPGRPSDLIATVPPAWAVVGNAAFRDVSDQVQVTVFTPTANDDGFPLTDGDIRFYRIEMDERVSFDSGVGGAPLITYNHVNADLNSDGDDLATASLLNLSPCAPGTGCTFIVGQEVQTISVTSATGKFTAGSYKLRYQRVIDGLLEVVDTACIDADATHQVVANRLNALHRLVGSKVLISNRGADGTTVLPNFDVVKRFKNNAGAFTATANTYYVYFSGVNVKGDQPQLRVVDAFTGSCAAATGVSGAAVFTGTHMEGAFLTAGQR